MQLEKLVRLRDEGVVSMQKLGDTGLWYQNKFSKSAATAQVALTDWRNEGRKSIWYNCCNYRCGLYLENGNLLFRDVMKFDDRYRERYLDQPCEGWLATYDNLPLVDNRMWSKENRPSILCLQKNVTELAVSEQNETALSVSATFADGTQGVIVLSEEGITFCDCGVLYYRWGVPTEEDNLSFTENCLKASHRGFDYVMPVIGNVIPDGDGFLLQPENGKLCIQMDAICL